MSVNKAVHKLNVDLHHLRHAEHAEKSARHAEKSARNAETKATRTEKHTRAQIASEVKQITDAFESGSLSPTESKTAMNRLFALGEKDQKAVDAFHTAMHGAKHRLAHAKKLVAHDRKMVAHDRKKARHDLKPAEYHLSLKQTNKDRRALGLKALKHALRPKHKGKDAIKAARSVLGHDIQQLKYSGPLKKYLDKWPSSHVCCANFVSACLEKEGLIKPSQHSDSVYYLAQNLHHDKDWKHVSASHMKPGDVVCFEVPGEGHWAHVEMFAGYRNGVAEFIGSNNINSDGSQRISEGHVGYHIDAVYRYEG